MKCLELNQFKTLQKSLFFSHPRALPSKNLKNILSLQPTLSPKDYLFQLFNFMKL